MTVSKILERLVRFGPPIIDPQTRLAAHCVLSTVIAVDVLQMFNVDARALSVRAIVANRAYIDGVARGLSAPVIGDAGGWILDTGVTTGQMAAPSLWRGHLIAWLPAHGRVIDLNLGAFSRPAHQIHLPAAADFPFRPPDGVYPINGAQVEYVAHPDDVTWTRAVDYTQVQRRKNLVTAIVRAIRCGKLR